MSISRRKFLTACLGAGAFAVTGYQMNRIKQYNERWFVFGTLLDVTIATADTDLAKKAMRDLAAMFQKMNNDWHPWKPGIMQGVNHAIAQQQSVAVDEHFVNMIVGIQNLYRDSKGLFNPAIGHVVSSWGFHDNADAGWVPPDDQLIAELLSTNPSPADIDITDGVLSSRNSHVKLDLGGYAKGYAIDQGIEYLQSAGIEHAVINAGGDLVSLGQGDNRPWRIGVRHPLRYGSIAWLETEGREAVFTSGNYERYNEAGGRKYAHIIDPRNGMPVNEIASATVVHEDAAIADAAATSLVVAGLSSWEKVAADMGIDQAMIIDESGVIAMTDKIKHRIQVSG